jgi:hypothetical protein
VTVHAVAGETGAFRCTYTPQFAGQYKITVKQAKLHITAGRCNLTSRWPVYKAPRFERWT